MALSTGILMWDYLPALYFLTAQNECGISVTFNGKPSLQDKTRKKSVIWRLCATTDWA